VTQNAEFVEALDVRLPQRVKPRTARDLFAIDERASIVCFAQTTQGRTLLGLLLIALFVLSGYSWVAAAVYVVSAGAYAFFPRHRSLVLAVPTLAVAFAKPARISLDSIIESTKAQEHVALSTRVIASVALAAFFLFAWVTIEGTRRNKKLFIARRPVIALSGILLSLCAVAASSVLHGVPKVLLWAFVAVLAVYLWYVAYAIVDQRSRDRSPALFQIGTFYPYWACTSVPFGKGAGFLRKHQAKTDEQLAISQLKGLKLAIWAFVLLELQSLIGSVLNNVLRFPQLSELLARHVTGQAISVPLSWCALIWATASSALSLAVMGHHIIAIARFAGFKLPRNTWRPLESRTLADFWNRYYYYYFKELLVDFFFMPTFLKAFRKYPRFRVSFATFVAAGVGNAVYHFLRDVSCVVTIGAWQSLVSYSSYLFYCTALAGGIAVSQARANSGMKPSNTPFGYVWSFVCVWGFVACLHIFGDESRLYTLCERLSFMGHLFGVN
jgi:hypothetical protein